MKAKFKIEVEFESMEDEDVSQDTLIERIRQSIEDEFESKYYKEDLNIRILNNDVTINS